MYRYFFQKAACAVLALISGLALMVSVYSIVALALARNVTFVTSNIDESETLLLEELDIAAEQAALLSGLPAEALQGAINSDNASVLNAEIARMFTNSYTADYSESTALYNAFYNKLVAYSESSGQVLSEKQMIAAASLAVNCVNNRFAGSDTANVQLFRLSGDMRILYIIIGSIVAIAGSIVMIILMTQGRHRQFSYFGMGLTIAGLLMIIVPVVLLKSGIVSDYRYCVNDVYNIMVVQFYREVVRLLMYTGIPFLIAGIVMLLLNYDYYRKKLIKARESREKLDKVKDMYMETPKPRGPLTESEKAEKTFLNIDFDE